MKLNRIKYFAPPLALLLILAFSASSALAQFETKHWYFGFNAGVIFTEAGPKVDTKGALISGENCTSYSDPCTGELMFYSNGQSIWGADHQFIQNGQGLRGSVNTSQGVLILPAPDGEARFYVYAAGSTTGSQDSFDPFVSVSILDTNGNDGNWRVWIKNQVIMDSTAEKLAATQTCDGEGFWIVSHHLRLNTFYIVKLDKEGRYDEVRVQSNIGTQPPSPGGNYEPWKWHFNYGTMKFSPNGKLLCLVSSAKKYVELFKFDNVLGIFSDPIKIDIENWTYYGCAFSPDSQKLYLTMAPPFEIVQYDLMNYDPSNIIESKLIINEPDFSNRPSQAQTIQLGPDGKVYVGDLTHLDVINYPNAKGLACDFQDNVLFLDGQSPGNHGSLPAFVNSWLSDPPDAALECARPYVKFEADTVLCAGEYLKIQDLTRRNPSSWKWSFEGGEPARFDGPEPPEILFSKPGLFRISLQAENDNGVDSGEVFVRVHPQPDVKLGSDITVCRGESVTLQAEGADRYEWRNDPGIQDVNSARQEFTPELTAEYVVCGWNEFGCVAYDTIQVTVTDKLVAEAGQDVTLCRGESVVLSGSGGAEYEWSPDVGLDDVNSATPTAQPNTTTLYRLRVRSGSCDAEDSVLVTVVPAARIGVGPDVTICPGETAGLTANGALRYEWSPDVGLDDVNSATPKAQPAKTTRYRVLGYSANNCVDSAFVTVNVENRLDLIVNIPEPVCRGTEVRLQVSGADEYQWEPAEMFTNPTIARPRLTLNENVTVRVRGRSGACEATQEIELRVLPEPQIEIEPVAEICPGESVELRASGGVGYLWEPAEGLDDVNSPTPRAAPQQTTEYSVTARDVNGCVAQQSVTVVVQPASDLTLEVVSPAGRAALPGDERIVGIRLQDALGTLPDADLRSIELTLQLPLRGLGLRREVTPVLNGWTWTATPDHAAGTLRIGGVGTQALSQGILFQLPLTVYQHAYDSLVAPIEIIEHSLAQSSCGRLNILPGGIPLSAVCLSQSRNIALSGLGFALHAPAPNPVGSSFELEFETAFDVFTTLELYSSLGTRIQQIEAGELAAGTHVRRVENLAPGVYQLVMRAGPFTASRSVVVMK